MSDELERLLEILRDPDVRKGFEDRARECGRQDHLELLKLVDERERELRAMN